MTLTSNPILWCLGPVGAVVANRPQEAPQEDICPGKGTGQPMGLKHHYLTGADLTASVSGPAAQQEYRSQRWKPLPVPTTQKEHIASSGEICCLPTLCQFLLALGQHQRKVLTASAEVPYSISVAPVPVLRA